MQKGAPKTAAGAPATAGVPVSDLRGDAPDSYTVQKGDTLWGIAGKFLKNPWQWPEIWNMNKDRIKDPHRIYPGDVIRLDKSGATASLSLSSGGTAEEAAANVVRVEPRIRVETLRTAIPSIPSTVIGPFLTQPLVVEAGGLDNAPSIVANDEARVIVGAGDVTYADRIVSTEIVNWQVFRPGQPLTDPENGELLGYEAKYIGDARVKRFGPLTTLEVTKAREEINRGDRLMPARELSMPSYVPHAPDKPIQGVIMSVDGGVSELGQVPDRHDQPRVARRHRGRPRVGELPHRCADQRPPSRGNEFRLVPPVLVVHLEHRPETGRGPGSRRRASVGRARASR
jgi:LysM repeat protein